MAPFARLLIRAMAIALTLLPVAAFAAGQEGVTERYYAVHGETLAEMNAVIRANAPRGGLSRGMGVIGFDRRFKLEADGGGCRVASAMVDAKATLILPKWRAGSEPAKPVAGSWRALERRIRAHEYTHVSIARRYAGLMQARLARLKAAGPCYALGAEANRVIEATLKEHGAAQRAFDARSLGRLTKRR